MVHCWLLLFEIFNKQLLIHVSSRLSSFLTAICAVAVKDLCIHPPTITLILLLFPECL